MPSAPKGETLEQKKERYLQAGYNQAKTRKQNRNPDGSLKVTEDDLWYQANNYMMKMLDRDAAQNLLRKEHQERMALEDEDYRLQQEEKYRAEYEWNTSNDEAALVHLLDLEVQIRSINRDILASASANDRDKLRKSLTDTVREHRQLQQNLGIDRPAREKKTATGDPMDDWDRIKREATVKKQQQLEKFLHGDGKMIKGIENVETEGELRDIIKYGLLLKFDVIDPLLSHHRRVLGLPTEVQKTIG
jgi:hypothetical protein